MVIIIINNNGIFFGVEEIPKGSVNTDISPNALGPDAHYEIMGNAFGFKGIEVKTHEELEKTMKEILANPDSSYLVNVRISPFG
jgi:thiamine pyrophosphate-dependent acetolactate synthase large subunit-like protein